MLLNILLQVREIKDEKLLSKKEQTKLKNRSNGGSYKKKHCRFRVWTGKLQEYIVGLEFLFYVEQVKIAADMGKANCTELRFWRW